MDRQIETREFVKLHCTLFNHYRQEVIHHKSKIKFFLTIYVSVASAVLIFQKDYIFNKDNIYWILLAASSILIYSVYCGLCFHSIRVLTMSANRDHCEWHIRKLIGSSISLEDMGMESNLIWYNIPEIGSVLGVIIIEILFIITIFSFSFNLWDATCNKENIETGKAMTVIISLGVSWLAITILTGIAYINRLKQYHKIAKELKNTRKELSLFVSNTLSTKNETEQ